jgi:spermidine/putrescine-binding protein
MPTEGCILWSDNMVIPVGAPNTAAALAWADFVYRPEVQADIASYTGVVSPVEGIEEVDPSLAGNQLVNPPQEFTEDCSFQPDPPGSEEDMQEVIEAFQAVITQ